MSARGYHRGHEMVFDESTQKWVYVDTGQNVHDLPDRDCGSCGLPNTDEGHDGCIADLPGVTNACCGHGRPVEAYIQFADGRQVSGVEAREMQEVLQIEPCIGSNPGCPCQDGLLCHYKGENAWPIP